MPSWVYKPPSPFTAATQIEVRVGGAGTIHVMEAGVAKGFLPDELAAANTAILAAVASDTNTAGPAEM